MAGTLVLFRGLAPVFAEDRGAVHLLDNEDRADLARHPYPVEVTHVGDDVVAEWRARARLRGLKSNFAATC